jgi:hypothetical protein
MKPEKHQKTTPEESLRASCEKGMGLELNYNEIRDRLDTTEISRVGKARKAAKPAMIPTDAPAPAPRRAFPAILLVLAVLILTPALAVGSFLIARSTMDPLPPDETVDSMPPLGTSPDQSFTPGGSTIVTPRPIIPNASGEAWGNIFNLTESYATENAMFLRAEHLDPAMTEGDLPAVLKVSDSEAWRQLFSQEPVSDNPALQAFFTQISADFFWETPLLMVITAGRSGSIRYRLDGIYTDPGEKLTLELTAEVPPALTMDIAHWCVLVPIPKAAAELPVELALRDEPMWDVEAPDDVITDIIINPYQLWFKSDSYAQNGCLYGRLGYSGDWHFPHTETVNTYAEWQSLYLGCSVGSISDSGFTEGLAALDEAFFAEQSLLILYREEGSGSNRHRVDQVIVEDGTVTVTLTTLEPEIFTCDMAYWAILIPMDKESAGLPVEIVGKSETIIP